MFAAIVGHADDADLLRICIEHHLSIGIDRIFVALDEPDDDSLVVVREFEFGDKVRAAPIKTFAQDPFHFFTPALDVVRNWIDPEWTLIVDTDEFWLPAHGSIRKVANLEKLDLLSVSRYNAVPIRESNGYPRPIAKPDLSTPIVTKSSLAPFYAETPAADWLRSGIAPKVMVRPKVVDFIMRGGHAVKSAEGYLRQGTPPDLLIVHLPFSTRDRFQRKVARIQEYVRRFGDRVIPPGEAMHWQRWIDMNSTGLADAEFDRQFVKADDIESGRHSGQITTAAEIYSRLLQQ